MHNDSQYFGKVSMPHLSDQFIFSIRKQIDRPLFCRTSSYVIRSSSGMCTGSPFGKTVSPPSFFSRSDMYNKIVANLFPPVPPDS